MVRLNSSERDMAHTNNISEEKRFKFYKNSWTSENEIDPELNDLLTVDPVELDELEEIRKSFKDKESPGNDDMDTELLKYAPIEIKIGFSFNQYMLEFT
jgi:hypothetical protein